MPGSHQMSGLFIHLGVSCPGCLLAGLDLPQGVTAPLPLPQKKGCFWCSSVPCPYLWLLLSDVSLVFSVSYSQRGKEASYPPVAVCAFLLPVTQTWIQRSPVHRNPGLFSQGSASPRSACMYLHGKMVWASRNSRVKERREYESNLICHAKLC